MPTIEQLIAAVGAEGAEGAEVADVRSDAEKAATLISTLNAYQAKKPFEIGEFVVKDPKFGDIFKFPNQGQPGVVVGFNGDGYGVPSDDNGSTWAGTPFDTKVAIPFPDGTVEVYVLPHKALIQWVPES